MSLALDAAGNPRINYWDWDGSNGDLKYAWRDSAGWQNETVDSAGQAGEYTSLALDAAGNPRISYCNPSNNDLMFAKADVSPPVAPTTAAPTNAAQVGLLPVAAAFACAALLRRRD